MLFFPILFVRPFESSLFYTDCIPPDVILLGENKGVVGVAEWPIFTLQDTIDKLDTLDQVYHQDQHRVSKNPQCNVYCTIIFYCTIY